MSELAKAIALQAHWQLLVASFVDADKELLKLAFVAGFRKWQAKRRPE